MCTREEDIKTKRSQQYKPFGLELGTSSRVEKAACIRKTKRHELVQAKRRLNVNLIESDVAVALDEKLVKTVYHKLSFNDALKVYWV